jgi:hypothetical protein
MGLTEKTNAHLGTYPEPACAYRVSHLLYVTPSIQHLQAWASVGIAPLALALGSGALLLQRGVMGQQLNQAVPCQPAWQS